jgi:hypothetical protein
MMEAFLKIMIFNEYCIRLIFCKKQRLPAFQVAAFRHICLLFIIQSFFGCVVFDAALKPETIFNCLWRFDVVFRKAANPQVKSRY